jgi:hypothetical protein
MVDATHFATAEAELSPPDTLVANPETAPVAAIDSDSLRMVGMKLNQLFLSYVSDRRIQELKWTRNLRQYLGLYDPEVEKEMSANRSKAYPRVTRAKVISIVSRVMQLMFPGDERNWELKASPSPDMSPEDVQQAIMKAMQKAQEMGLPPTLDDETIEYAVQALADERAEDLSKLIDDQLQELGGDQTLDYVHLVRKVVFSGVLYGLGVMTGPFARPSSKTKWEMDPYSGMPMPTQVIQYKPMYEFLPVWDFYPDLSAKTFHNMDGYFKRLVMSRGQVRKLMDRTDFLGDQIREYLNRTPRGNYKPQPFETELRAMGVKVNVNEQKAETSKYEIIIWNGVLSGQYLSMCGVEVDPERHADDLDAEIWMIDGNIIKADLNPWRKLGVEVKTVHAFVFDEDDTSPVGNGLPNVMRDSQMSIAAATRMLLDNASVVCGPNLELNTDLLRMDQDLTSASAYKIWYREGMGADAAQPAVRNLTIDSHIDELLKMVDLFMKFADMETFVGPATGGDMERGRMPSEPMRTAAGASMLRGDAALPFKDIIRNFDTFTQSVIYSLVYFNRTFNPGLAPEGDFDVVARGATSLMAKEVRGTQIDQLLQNMPDLQAKLSVHTDERKFAEALYKVRDLGNLLVSPDEAKRREQQAQQAQQASQQAQQALNEANERKLLSDAYKNIAQGQKNSANADAEAVNTMLNILDSGMETNDAGEKPEGALGAGASSQPAQFGNPEGA